MQTIISFSKYVLLTALMSTILLTWYGDVTDVITLTPEYSSEVRSADISATTTNANAATTPAKQTGTDTIWNTLRGEFKLDTRAQSAQVQAEIRKLLADPTYLSNILKASVPYIYFIHQQTDARGLPAELALIPVIESEFNPNDRSNKGATGLWQLMTVTAHELGVKVMSGYDGRRSVTASTKAALAYFKDLGQYFNGNWDLAIAAYNCGQMRVKSAMRRANSDSFWNLPLPKETQYYVPRLLAVAAIVKNPEKYGVKLPPVSNQPYFEEVKVEKTVSLDKVAKSTGVNIDTLNRLNPDYTHGSNPKTQNASLLVPVDQAPTVKAQYASAS